MNDWKDKRVYVMGLGRFGGGIGVSRYLASKGAQLRIADLGSDAALRDSIDQIKDLITEQKAELRLGEHDPADLDGVDVLVVNPAVPMPWTNAFIAEARSRGIVITTEIEIAYRLLNPDRVIAITGSAGKSTTSAMIHHALIELGIESELGGNIGGSILERADSITKDHWIVLEFSSAMLYWLGQSGIVQEHAPAVGVVTNCIKNHLDWHGDFEHYERSKMILAKTAQRMVLGEQVAGWGSVNAVVVDHADGLEACAIPGMHNAHNAAMAANAVSLATGIDSHIARSAVCSFAGLPHRMQLVDEVDGIRFYNDSKCTVPDATLLAIDAIAEIVEPSKIHLIAGGYDKGSDLSLISQRAVELAGLYTIGATGKSLYAGANGNAYLCETLEFAMRTIAGRVSSGDVVMLSPGCASWDQFENYEIRGEQFAQIVNAMKRSSV